MTLKIAPHRNTGGRRDHFDRVADDSSWVITMMLKLLERHGGQQALSEAQKVIVRSRYLRVIDFFEESDD